MAGDLKVNAVDDSAGDAQTIREEIISTAEDIQIDESTAVNMTEKTIKDGAMNHEKDENIIVTGHSNTSLTERISTWLAWLGLGLAIALVGAILGLAVLT